MTAERSHRRHARWPVHGARLLVASCLCTLASAAETPIDQLGWLAGCWRTLNAEPGSGEMWSNGAGGSMLGLSRTVRDGRTVSYEFMRIAGLPDGRLAFFAQPSGKPPATFAAVILTPTEVVFENAEHAFPQRVIYRRDTADKLDASIEGTVGGDARSVRYPMERAHC